ncbi:uncharacterized protein OCT59_021297 [Rhizophagus irregularis]|nr:hypothetical protein RirG_198640 [Rhizophagus irregularis DAOM 197198w]UZO02819.1 hypothetical protein OCT59_021297 [Rhizophagus irregularis]
MYNNWNDLIEKGSDILLGIDEKVRRCLENFMKNLSNRKRIDEEYFIEMLVIEKFLKEERYEIRYSWTFRIGRYREEKGRN